MIKTIDIPNTSSYNRNRLFFKSIDLTQLPDLKIVPLFGPNGSGKTTLLKAINTNLNCNIRLEYYKQQLAEGKIDKTEYEFYEEDIMHDNVKMGCDLELDHCAYQVLTYNNSNDNFRHRKARSMFEDFDPYYIKNRLDAQSVSEGQSIVHSIYNLFECMKPGKNMSVIENGHTIVLIDEMDSGLSLDNLDMFMRKLQNIIKKRNDIQVFMSFNNPYILKYFPYCISMYTGEMIELHNTEDMLMEINKHKDWFNKARKLSNGRPKIFE